MPVGIVTLVVNSTVPLSVKLELLPGSWIVPLLVNMPGKVMIRSVPAIFKVTPESMIRLL